MDDILGDQPEVKEKVFTILKQYAAERKVEYLAYALCMVLTQECHQHLIDNIRYRVPGTPCTAVLATDPQAPICLVVVRAQGWVRRFLWEDGNPISKSAELSLVASQPGIHMPTGLTGWPDRCGARGPAPACWLES